MYVIRDDDGNIVTAFAAEQEDATEYIEPDDPELVAFLAKIHEGMI